MLLVICNPGRISFFKQWLVKFPDVCILHDLMWNRHKACGRELILCTISYLQGKLYKIRCKTSFLTSPQRQTRPQRVNEGAPVIESFFGSKKLMERRFKFFL